MLGPEVLGQVPLVHPVVEQRVAIKLAVQRPILVLEYAPATIHQLLP